MEYLKYRSIQTRTCYNQIEATHQAIQDHLNRVHSTAYNYFYHNRSMNEPPSAHYQSHVDSLCSSYSQVLDKECSMKLYEHLRNSHRTSVSNTINDIATKMKCDLEKFRPYRFLIKTFERNKAYENSYNLCKQYIRKLERIRPFYVFDPVLNHRSLGAKLENIRETHMRDVNNAASFIMAFFDALKRCDTILNGKSDDSGSYIYEFDCGAHSQAFRSRRSHLH